MADPKNYYKTLNLPSPSSPPFQHTPSTPSEWTQEVKKAYRRALLQHHPDKASSENTNKETIRPRTKGPSIDDIKKAYFVLSDSTRREEYNKSLALQRLHPNTPDSGIDISSDDNNPSHSPDEDFILGLEIVDLDDMVEDGDEWYRSCRCGMERGFVVSEAELEEVEGKGGREVLVGCRGCSLWVRVGFGVLDEDVKEGEG